MPTVHVHDFAKDMLSELGLESPVHFPHALQANGSWVEKHSKTLLII